MLNYLALCVFLLKVEDDKSETKLRKMLMEHFTSSVEYTMEVLNGRRKDRKNNSSKTKKR